MTTAIHYFSKFGHTEQMVKAIEPLVGAKAQVVTEPLKDPVDVLFLGAGVMLGKVDKSVMQFIDTLTPDKVKCAVLFGSSAIIESPVPQMHKALEAKGISVSDKSFTCKGSMGPLHSGHPNAQDIATFKQFVQEVIKLIV